MTTSTNGSDRLKQQAIPIGLGVLCILFAYGILTWNEHRVGQMVAEPTAASASIAAGSTGASSDANQSPGFGAKAIATSPIDPENNGRVVFMSGVPKSSDTLSDTGFDVERVALRLKRQVYMFQWQQVTTADPKTGVSKIAFQKVWSRELIDDKKFDFQSESSPYRNPKKIAIEETELVAKVVILGDFRLSTELVKAIPYNDTIDLSTIDVVKVRNKFSQPVEVKHDRKMLYIGSNPDQPQIGDLRVELIAAQPQLISVAAMQNHGSLDPINGKSVILQAGQLTLEQLLSKKPDAPTSPAAADSVTAPAVATSPPVAEVKPVPAAEPQQLTPPPAAVPQEVYLASWTFRIIGTGAMIAGFLLLGPALQTRITMLQGSRGYMILTLSAVIASLFLIAFCGFAFHRMLSLLLLLVIGGLGYLMWTQLCPGKPPTTPA